MKFGQLTSEELIKKIAKLNITRWPMMGFHDLKPKQDKVMKLKQTYKPHADKKGDMTVFSDAVLADAERMEKIRNNMYDKGFYGSHYNAHEASLKLHVSLNDIENIDEDVVLGLVKLLFDTAESPDNNISFHFKIIDPSLLVPPNRDRFNMNDQITIYFDKYSCVSDMHVLSDKINSYLKTCGVAENAKPRGPKDVISLNSFVTARFDNNKLLERYDVYPFFDLELKELFSGKISRSEFMNIPLCCFEAVFITVISSPDIIIPHAHSENKALSQLDSIKVQAEFNKMLRNPKAYLQAAESIFIEQERVISSREPDTTHPVNEYVPLNKLISYLDNKLTALKGKVGNSEKLENLYAAALNTVQEAVVVSAGIEVQDLESANALRETLIKVDNVIDAPQSFFHIKALEKNIELSAPGHSTLWKKLTGALLIFLGVAMVGLSLAAIPFTGGLSAIGSIGGGLLITSGILLFRSGMQKSVAADAVEVTNAAKLIL